MKKLLALCGSIATMLLFTPLTILAAESGESSTATVPLWLCIPFAGLLLCIAVLPLVKPEWWEKNQPLAVAVWSLLFIIPFAVTYSAGDAVETVLECILNDYLTFIVLLFGLFCVAGNITLEGDLAGSPRVNVIFLAIGTLLSSCIGTTGASMLMVRPMIKMNSWRQHKSHIMVFFIFLISNMGGCLTPIGDPPLLMGLASNSSIFYIFFYSSAPSIFSSLCFSTNSATSTNPALRSFFDRQYSLSSVSQNAFFSSSGNSASSHS